MQAVFRRIAKFARRDVSVLIQGETGTGKDLVASAVQGLSARKDRPYEIVNCATLTRELLPRELFGHERGAFTGAVARKQGLLALAHGGTVFLDEVGELALDTQGMLLRFLDGGELRPVGSTRTIRTDVRVVAPRTATWRRRWGAASSARTFTTGSATSSSRSLRSGHGRTTSRS